MATVLSQLTSFPRHLGLQALPMPFTALDTGSGQVYSIGHLYLALFIYGVAFHHLPSIFLWVLYEWRDSVDWDRTNLTDLNSRAGHTPQFL